MADHRIASKSASGYRQHSQTQMADGRNTPLELVDDTASSFSASGEEGRIARAAQEFGRTADEDVEIDVDDAEAALALNGQGSATSPSPASPGAGPSTVFLDLSDLQDSLPEDSSSDVSSLSSDSLELESGASTDGDNPGAAPPPTPSNGAARAPAAFRTPVRRPRARAATHAIASSPPKTPRSSFLATAVPPDFPLPHPLFEFDILNHVPARHPVPPPGWKEPRERTALENSEEAARARERRRRVEEGRRLRETEGREWEWEWVREGPLGFVADTKGKGEAKETGNDYHAASFFPYEHLPGLSHMSGVLAIAGGDELELFQLSDVSTSASDSPLVKLISRKSDVKLDPTHRDREEYFTCAWSVNITTHPYTPVLAVAGRGRVIDVFLVGRRATGEWVLHKERTITGHGGSIHHLAFHPLYPHLLASASEDKTIRLWDTTLPWGTDATLSARVRAAAAKSAGGGQKGAVRRKAEEALRRSEGGRTARPRVEGELLGVLAEGGHEKAVMSCDFHATLPLLVSAGNDGFIRLWQLPPSVLDATPYWPRTPLHRHPPSPPPFAHAPSLGPPIFSSYAIHPGQWPDQVLFASPTTCTILSKAPVTHPDARFSPRTSIKLWVPSVLDVLPSSASSADRPAAVEHARLAARAQGSHAVPALVPLRAPLPPYARSDSAFRVLGEAVVEAQNCVGDKVGWYRPLPGAGGEAEPFVVVGMATPLPLHRDGANDGDEKLYFFRPFAPPPVPPSVAAPAPTAPAMARFGSSSSSTSSGVRASAARTAQLDAAAAALFPPGRDRAAHDFTPRLLPSAVADVFPGASAAAGASGGAVERERVHWRAIAVAPGGARVVAVGDDGKVGVFRRRRCRSKGAGEDGERMEE